MSKKLSSLLLSGALLLSSLAMPAVSAAAAETKAGFPDVNPDGWSAPAINRWTEFEVLKGYEDNTFRPKNDVTRKEVAVIFTRVFGLVELPAENPFVDIDLESDAWFNDAVLKCYEAGLMLGDNEGKANPHDPISRQDMFVMLGRGLDVVPLDMEAANKVLSAYPDGAQVSNYAKGIVAALIEDGIVSGMQGKLNPKDTINRESLAALLDKAISLFIVKPGEYVLEDSYTIIRTSLPADIRAAGEVTLTGTMTKDIFVAPGSGSDVEAPIQVNLKAVKADPGSPAKLSLKADNTAVSVDKDSFIPAVEMAANNADLAIAGAVPGVEVVSGENVTVVAKEGATIGEMAVSDGKNVAVDTEKGATINNVNVNGGKEVLVKGDGTVKEATINGGSGVKVNTPDTPVTVPEDSTAEDVTSGDKPVMPGDEPVVTEPVPLPTPSPKPTATPDPSASPSPSASPTVAPSSTPTVAPPTDTTPAPLVKKNGDIKFTETAGDPYELLTVSYTRQALDKVTVEGTIPDEDGTAKTVWKEIWESSADKPINKGNGQFTWSMRDMSTAITDGSPTTPTGSDAVDYERNDEYIIPVGTVITITVTGEKSGKNPKSIEFTHTVTEENIQKVWYGQEDEDGVNAGWPVKGVQPDKQGVEDAMKALSKATFVGNLAENGYVADLPNTVDVTVDKTVAKTTKITLDGNVKSGLATGHDVAFNVAQFDPFVAKDGYTSFQVAGINASDGAKKYQTNPALTLYPRGVWQANITLPEGKDVPVKAHDVGSLANAKAAFLLIKGGDFTYEIMNSSDVLVETYAIDNNLEFEVEEGKYEDDASTPLLNADNTSTDITALVSEDTATKVAFSNGTDSGEYTWKTVALVGENVATGFGDNQGITELFNAEGKIEFDPIPTYASFNLLKASQTYKISQINGMLSYYYGDGKDTNVKTLTPNPNLSSDAVISAYVKVKSGYAPAQDDYLAFLLAEGKDVILLVENTTSNGSGEKIGYYIVNHVTPATATE